MKNHRNRLLVSLVLATALLCGVMGSALASGRTALTSQGSGSSGVLRGTQTATSTAMGDPDDGATHTPPPVVKSLTALGGTRPGGIDMPWEAWTKWIWAYWASRTAR